MRIRTQFVLTMSLFGILLAVIAVSLTITNQQVARLNQQEEAARRIVLGARELSYLSNDYLLYREGQQRTRWEAREASFSTELSRLSPDTPEQQALLNHLRANQQRMKDVFSDVVSTVEGASGTQPAAPDMAFVRVSWSRMQVQHEGMVFDASRLSQALREQADEVKQWNIILIFALLGACTAFVLANYLIVYRRALGALADLEVGTAIIGSGKLDFAIAVKRDDEIGALCLAFNRMTANLKSVTASKAELESEIAERKRAEDRANQQRAIQEGINRILEASLTCTTVEELGRASLTVAEQLTGSKFGFVGKLNAAGRLDDLAISDPGWDVCRMEPPTGHRVVPIGFTVHGIYGRVLLDGKGFFTNDPASHPDRIGIPAGHPPLQAFLGVPLTRAGKTVGMVGLGNREGGYRAEDQEAAEAIAAAIVEAFERKRAEEEIRHLNESLSQRAAELEVSNRELEAFSYSVSHDLRAPLRHMHGFSQALLEDYADKLDEQAKQYLGFLRQGSLMMSQLLDDLLRLSHVTRTEMSRVRVDVSALAESITRSLRMQEPERQVEFVIEPGIVGHGDPNLVRLALENLLGNAWKFTARREHARIELSVALQHGEPVYCVRDNGAGFDMAYADKLFAAFQRLHTAEEFPGTGIGLATVQRIVSRHGGRVWAEGVVGEGASFYFTLQRRSDEGEDEVSRQNGPARGR